MHTSALAFESATLASVMFMAFGMITMYAWWLGLRFPWLLAGAGGLFVMMFYFGLLAVSAGPAPVIPRAVIALALRLLLVAGTLLLAVPFAYAGRLLLRAGVLWFGWTEW